MFSRKQKTGARKPAARRSAKKTNEMSKKGPGIRPAIRSTHGDTETLSRELNTGSPRASSSRPCTRVASRVRENESSLGVMTAFVPRTGNRVGKWRNGKKKEGTRESSAYVERALLITRYGDATSVMQNCFRHGVVHRCALCAAICVIIRCTSRRASVFPSR